MKTNSSNDPLSAAEAGDVGGGSRGGGDTKMVVGRRKTSSRGHPRFVGVRQRRSGKWVAEIKDSLKNARLWLGTFDTVEDAARAYDKAARAIRGVNARTNFELPESAASESGSHFCLPENVEPFSFEEVCGGEEPDGLLGALRAKLFDGKKVLQVISPQQANSSSGESSNISVDENNVVFGSTRDLSSITTSPSAPYEVPLVTLDSSSGIVGATMNHNQASNNTPEAKTFDLFQLDRGLFGAIENTWPLTTHEATDHMSYLSNCSGEESISKNGIVEEDTGKMPIPASQVSATNEGFWPSDEEILHCDSMSWENDANASWDPVAFLSSVLP